MKITLCIYSEMHDRVKKTQYKNENYSAATIHVGWLLILVLLFVHLERKDAPTHRPAGPRENTAIQCGSVQKRHQVGFLFFFSKKISSGFPELPDIHILVHDMSSLQFREQFNIYYIIVTFQSVPNIVSELIVNSQGSNNLVPVKNYIGTIKMLK